MPGLLLPRHLQSRNVTIHGIPPTANSNTIPMASMVDEAVLRGPRPATELRLGLTSKPRSLPRTTVKLLCLARILSGATVLSLEKGVTETQMPTTIGYDSMMIIQNGNDALRLMPHTGKIISCISAEKLVLRLYNYH
jgi:hypothetical protein